MKTCTLCSEKIPSRVLVNGVSKTLSSRRYCLKCSPFGRHNNRKLVAPLGVLTRSRCQVCGKEYDWPDASGNNRQHKCGACYSNENRTHIKRKAVDYLGGKCIKCGYDKCLSALVFHHRDPSKKYFSISGSHCRAWSVLRKELDKCDLLCANCHQEEHENLTHP